MPKGNGGSAHLLVGGKLTCESGLHVDERKIREYLLNSKHQFGAGKAAYFEQRGFSLEDWEVLREALLSHGKTSKITNIEKHDYGTKIVVECMLSSPAGNDHCIRSVWNCHGDGTPVRLITAHPL